MDNSNYLSLNQSKRNFPRTNPIFKMNSSNCNINSYLDSSNTPNLKTSENFNKEMILEEDESPPPPPPRSVSTLIKRQSNIDFRSNCFNSVKSSFNRPISLLQSHEIHELTENFSDLNSMSQSTMIEGKSQIDLQDNDNDGTLSTTTETNHSDETLNSDLKDTKNVESDDGDVEGIMFEHHPNLASKLLLTSDEEGEANVSCQDSTNKILVEPKISSSSNQILRKFNLKVVDQQKCSGADQTKEDEFLLINTSYDWPKSVIKVEEGQNINSIMSFTKTLGIKRILSTTDKNVKKHFSELFKMIQSFMGDRKTRFSRPDLASVIIQRALNYPGIRDELFALICKQITQNPSMESLTRGWELMCVCLYYFPPSNNFREHLHGFIYERLSKSKIILHKKTSFSVPQMGSKSLNSLALASALALGNDPSKLIKPVSIKPVAIPSPNIHQDNNPIHKLSNKVQPILNECIKNPKYPDGPWLQNISVHHFIRSSMKCFNRAIRLSSNSNSFATTKSATNCNDQSRSLSISEICHVKDFILKPWLFGSSLEDIMVVQHHRFPNLRIPWIQMFLTEEILFQNGHKSEGIFRLSSDLDELSELRVSLERLFEPFQVVQLWSPVFIKNKVEKYENTNQINDINLPPKYHITRPPPDDWSKSLKQFKPENENNLDYPNTQIQLKIIDLTHDLSTFQLSEDEKYLKKNLLLPNLLDSNPVQYMLLTPRQNWPFNLSASSKEVDPNIPACLLKMWLRELSEPIIPEICERDCLAICDFDSKSLLADDESRINDTLSRECSSVVRKLPKLNRRCLLYLIKFLQFLSKPENANLTLMDSRNLATVIGPNLFRAKPNLEPREILESVRLQSTFVQILIERLLVESETIRLNWEERSCPPSYMSTIKNDLLTPPLVRLANDGSSIFC